MKAPRRTLVTIFGAGTLLLASAVSITAQVAEAELENTPSKVDPKTLATIQQRDTTAPENQVPYISCYYVDPKVNIDEQATINYYVTDYWHKDYVRDDDSERFTVDYWVNGKKNTINKVKAGDNSLVLPRLPKGTILFAIQCTDSKGRESHRLYQEFLIVDPKRKQSLQTKFILPT